MIDKINIIISLTAAIIVTIVGIIEQVSINSLVIRLIITIAVFFILGTIAKIKIKKILDDGLYDNLELYNVDLSDKQQIQDKTTENSQSQQNNILNV